MAYIEQYKRWPEYRFVDSIGTYHVDWCSLYPAGLTSSTSGCGEDRDRVGQIGQYVGGTIPVGAQRCLK